MQILSRFWNRVSLIGVDDGMDSRLRRKIILSNQLSFSVTIIVALAWLATLIAFHGKSNLALVAAFACASYAAPMFFNRMCWRAFSRIWFNLLPPIMILFVSSVMSDGQVVSMKVALLSVVIVPILLFGIEERGKMIAGIALVVAVYLGMDFVTPLIPNWIAIDPGIIDSPVSVGINGLVSLFLFILAFLYFQKLANDAEEKLALEKERSEELLLNILPEEIVATLKDHPDTIANQYDSASVLFADIVNFTPLSAQLSAVEVVKLLNEVFSYFDALVEKYDLEKIKTIGDCYMVAAGVPRPREDHAQALTRMALEAHEYFRSRRFLGRQISFRIGINSGPLVAGVIGRKKFIYDLWGDAVNTASRMETQGAEGCTQVTRNTYELIKDHFHCEPRGTVAVKGKGDMEIWHVTGIHQ